jgi:hypothetical protein
MNMAKLKCTVLLQPCTTLALLQKHNMRQHHYKRHLLCIANKTDAHKFAALPVPLTTSCPQAQQHTSSPSETQRS